MTRWIAFLVLIAAGVTAPATLAQSEAQSNPAFEVATIKPSSPDEVGFGVRVSGRRFISTNTSLIDLLSFAYALHPRQITGGPSWLATEKFDVLGQAGTPGNPDPQSVRTMVKNLIADRFRLTFHRDKKELSVYEIVVVKDGPKFTDTPGDPKFSPSFGFKGLGAMTVKSATVADFAGWMQRYVMDWPVVDHTDISGRYDFSLEWTPDETQFRDRSGLPPITGGDEHPDLYTAIQQQLGLKLQSTKTPVEVLVIDRVDRPSDN